MVMTVDQMAKILDEAMCDAREVERLTISMPDLSLDTAYAVMDQGIRLREGRGQKMAGLKMGLTSKAKMEQMGLHTPIYGVLMDQMKVEGGVFRLKGTIHPKIEPEIAFLIGKEVRGRLDLKDAPQVVSAVLPALEILDSRFLNFKYFSLPDVVADNSSSAFFIQGNGKKLTPDLLGSIDRLKMSLEVNGQVVQSADSSAILGNPLQSLVHLCELLHSRGKILPAGAIVLAGAATQAVQLEAGMSVRLLVDGFDPLSIKIES